MKKRLSRLRPRDLMWAIPLAVLFALFLLVGDYGAAVFFAVAILLGVVVASRPRRGHPSPPKSREQAAEDRLLAESLTDRTARWRL